MNVKIVEIYFLIYILLFILQKKFIRGESTEKCHNLNLIAYLFKVSNGLIELKKGEFIFTGSFKFSGTFQMHIEPEASECKNKKAFTDKGKAIKVGANKEETYRFGPFSAEESMALIAGLIFCINGQKENWLMPLLHSNRNYSLKDAKSEDLTEFDLPKSFVLSSRNFRGSEKAIGSAGVRKEFLPELSLLLAKPDYPLILKLIGISLNAEKKQITVEVSFTRKGHFEVFVKQRGYPCNYGAPDDEKRKFVEIHKIGEQKIIDDLYKTADQDFDEYRGGLIVCAKEVSSKSPYEEQIVVQPLLEEM